jgi:hypothetical protein
VRFVGDAASEARREDREALLQLVSAAPALAGAAAKLAARWDASAAAAAAPAAPAAAGPAPSPAGAAGAHAEEADEEAGEASGSAPKRPRTALPAGGREVAILDAIKADGEADERRRPGAATYWSLFAGPTVAASPPDYGDWVPAPAQVTLVGMRRKAAAGQYADAEAFLSDARRIRNNAEAYHGPGRSANGDPMVLAHAKELVRCMKRMVRSRVAPPPPPGPSRPPTARVEPARPAPVRRQGAQPPTREQLADAELEAAEQLGAQWDPNEEEDMRLLSEAAVRGPNAAAATPAGWASRPAEITERAVFSAATERELLLGRVFAGIIDGIKEEG